ncbi:MAG: FlgB family protein [Pseudomonadota bacterium]
MNDGLQLLNLAEALAGYASARQTLIARNVAHADTPGWRAQDLTDFADTYVAREARADGLAFRPAATRPGHAGLPEGAGAEAQASTVAGLAAPNGNTVSLEDQMVRAAQTRLQHEMALGVWRKSMDILRASLGPPR